jgi:hypothetical protein
MSDQQPQPLPVRKVPPAKPPIVYYSRHLWQTACQDAWAFVVQEEMLVLVSSVAIFVVAAFLTLLILGSDTLLQYAVSVAVGLVALGLGYGAFVTAHLLYLTPRKLLARKQVQVDFLRDEIKAKSAEIVSLKRSLAAKTVEKNERDKQPVTE